MISVVNKSWLMFQHIKVQGFSYIGVGVTECLNASTWAKDGAPSSSVPASN